MQVTNILEYLEDTVKEVPEKTAFSSEEGSLTFAELYGQSRSVGSYLCSLGYHKCPVVVFMKKTHKAIAAYLGVIYSGCFYVALDEEMPRHRIELIMQTVDAQIVICDEVTKDLISEYGFRGHVCIYEEIC